MVQLLNALKNLYESDAKFEIEGDRCYFINDDERVIDVNNQCCDLLIHNNGMLEIDNINILRNNGYRVFPGERDSFGWLTGCVQKRDDERILVFG